MNLQIALIFEGFAEALTLATKLGVDAEKLVALVEAHHGALRRGGFTRRLSCFSATSRRTFHCG